MTYDVVNKPAHYQTESGIECIQVAELLSYTIGNALKYAWRAGKKDNLIQDLKKCQWYLARAISNEEVISDDVIDKIQKILLNTDATVKVKFNRYFFQEPLIVAIVDCRLQTAFDIVSRTITDIDKETQLALQMVDMLETLHK